MVESVTSLYNYNYYSYYYSAFGGVKESKSTTSLAFYWTSLINLLRNQVAALAFWHATHHIYECRE